MYEVNCERANLPQIIHCDRMMKSSKQILTGEDVSQNICKPELELVQDTDPEPEVNDEAAEESVSDKKYVR